MAYNLQPLITILEQILNPLHTRWILDHNKPHLESLLEKAASLQHILGKKSLVKVENLESRIRDATHKAEDIIESQMVDHLLSIPRGMSFTFITPDLQQVTQELDSLKEQVEKLMKGKTTASVTSSSGASFSSSKSVVVGVDEDLLQLKDRLTGMQKKLEIVPIVGMGGLGKTTLARKLYEDKLILSSFKYCGWTTVSQDYNMRSVLLGLLQCIIGKKIVDDQHIGKENSELKDVLYKSLFRTKYMIILDDIWNIEFWVEIRSCFPHNDNGSRIVITTRESHVATYADSQSLQHQMQLLSQSDSWNLLQQIVFGDEDCPHPLQGIGEKIASDCGGLPLAIKVIGGLLSKVERSEDIWENIGNDVRAAIAKSDNFSEILSLSYNHLPNHLKPCFLYMSAFPEDYEIKPARLIRLWVAEGFVKSKGDKILEDEAGDYLKALVERNLLFIKEKKYNGKPKSYSIHDLLRELCMRKAEDEKFLYVRNSTELTFSNLRRVSVDTSYGMEDVYASVEQMSLARSLLSTGNGVLSSFFSALTLLRVLDVYDTTLDEFPTEVLQLVNLRYLAIATSIPSEISRLWNLQTLIAQGYGRVPFEIWELPELRHFKFRSLIRFREEFMKRMTVEKKLRITSNILLSDAVIRSGFLECIPHITRLGFWMPSYKRISTLDLSHLHKLEALTCNAYLDGADRRFLSKLIFPSSLRNLYLHYSEIFPGALTPLCELPNLEMLKLRECEFEREAEKDEECEAAYENDQEWEVAEGDVFRSLQFLCLESMWNLKRWIADETNFPRLRHLTISQCRNLEEIPCGIGEISTLQIIELVDCKDPLVDSAKQIVEEQQSEYENFDLQLHVSSYLYNI